MPSRRTALAALLAVAVASSPAAASIAITGEIRAADGKPVAGATARLAPLLAEHETARLRTAGKAAPAPAATATSDAAGRFELAAPAPGGWRVEVAADGFAGEAVDVVSLGDPVSLPALVLSRSASLTVLVSDAGKPVAGAEVEAMPDPETVDEDVANAWLDGNWMPAIARGTSGPDGQAVLAVRPDRPLTVRATAPGRAGARRGVSVPGPPVRIELAPLRWARGTVRDERTGRPIAGAFVWPAGEPSAAVATDASGSYQAVAPRADRPRLCAGAVGYFPASAAAPSSGAEPLPGPDLALTPAVTLAGSVVDEAGKGLDRVRLTVAPVDWAPARLGGSSFDKETATDAQGRFTLLLPPDREAVVVGRRPDFAPLRHTIPRLQAGETPPPLRLVMGRGITAFGRVVDADGKPVALATVSLVLASAPEHGDAGWLLLDPEGVETATDDAGRFQFERLVAGRFELQASAAELAPTVVRGLTVPQTPRFDLGTVVLRPGARLTGRVIDESGSPVKDVEVSLMTMGGDQESLSGDPHTVVTGPEGNFTFSGLAPGMAMLAAEMEGYGQTDFSLVEIPAADPVEIVLKRTLQVVCRIVDEAGRPVDEATVYARALAEEALGMEPRAVNTERGTVVVELPGPGRFEMTAAAPGMLGASQVVAVGPEGIPEGLRFTLAAGAVVAGKVEGPDGLPLPEAQVLHLAGEEANVSWSFAAEQGTTDGDGGYRLTGVAPGRHSFVAQRQGFRRQVRDLEVRPGENRLDFRLEPGVPVSGRVVDPDGAPVAGATVSLQGGLGATEEATTAADGGFVLPGLSPGTYRLSARKAGFADRWLVGILVASEPVSGIEVILGPTGSVRGRVLGLDPAALATVHVTASGESSSSQAEVDFEGNYRLDGLAPGDWAVMAMAGGRVQQGRVTVQAGAEAVFDLEFSQGFRLTGRVVADGSSVAGAVVVLAARASGGGGFAVAAADGTFHFDGLAAGAYDLVVQGRSGGFHYRKTIAIEGDTEVTIEALDVTVSGQVVDTAGEPLSGVRVVLKLENDPFSDETASTLTDPEGRFILHAASEGLHTLVARREGYGTVEVTVEPAASGVEGLRLTMAPAASLVLELAGPAGVAPDWVSIVLLDTAGRTAAAGGYTVGERGRVEIKSAAPGSYRLLAAGSNTAVSELDVRVPGGPLPVALAPEAKVRLRVASLTGSAFGAAVTVSDLSGRAFRTVNSLGVTASWTLQQGMATVGQLPPGTWRFQVTAPDGKSWDREVTVRVGESVELVIE